ncbi:MAG TPA: cupin domain-containing protein [Bryobacteraceae bacterium]|nr:cupin domain-containing protein [Bryobacteraceae bacterium]
MSEIWLQKIRKTAVVVALLSAPVISSQQPQPRPLAMPLECSGGDCALLRGAPQTTGMRSGFVRLKPGETVGWHTTGHNEEALVILHGEGAALIEGQPEAKFHAPALAYIPPETRHNVSTTGSQVLEYVYVVAPAATR